MKWLEIKVSFVAVHTELATDLIAGLFHDAGCQGVIIEDPGLAPDDGWGQGFVAPPTQPAVVGHLPCSPTARRRMAELRDALKRFERRYGVMTQVAVAETEDEQWAHAWKRFFKPLRVCRNIVVKPSWETFAAEAGDRVIEIDPGMAFGTGSHPTTVMCLCLIERFLKEGARFLDIGVGSGILSIAAVRLGATSVTGVDRDETALSVAADNFRRNGIAAACRLVCANLADGLRGRFDVVAANLLTEPIMNLLADVDRVMTRDGILICSGIISEKKAVMEVALQLRKFRILDINSQEGWIAIAARQSQE
jgi:ribosomal protein L11 methyltransferase